MAIAFQQIAQADSTGTQPLTLAVTMANPQTAGNCNVVFITFYHFNADISATIADSAGNTYTQVGAEFRDSGGNNPELCAFVAPNIKAWAGNIVTVTFTGGGYQDETVQCVEYSGVATASAGAAAYGHTTGGPTTSGGPAIASFTATTIGDMYLAVATTSTASIQTGVSGGTQRGSFTTGQGLGWVEHVSTSTSPTNMGFTLGSSHQWMVLGIILAQGAAAGPATGPGIAPSDRDPRLPTLALALRDLPQPGKGPLVAVPINYAAQSATWAPTITPAYRVPWLPKLCAQQLPMLGKTPLIAPPGNPRPLAVLILGQANTADPLNVARALTLPVSATSIVAVPLKASRALSLAVAGAASLGLTLKVARALAVAIVGSAAVVATMKAARGLLVAIVGRATIAAAANLARPLAVAIVGSSVVAFPLKVARALAVGILGAATVTGTMAVARACIVAIRGQATVDGALSVARGLVMATLGRASVSTPLSVSRALVMGVQGAATMADVLSVARAFVLAIHGHVAAGFDNGGTVQLAIGILGRANMTGTLAVQRNLAVSILARASLTEQLAVARAMGLAIDAAALLAATLGGAVVLLPRAKSFVWAAPTSSSTAFEASSRSVVFDPSATSKVV